MLFIRTLLIFFLLVGVSHAELGVIVDTTFDWGTWDQTQGAFTHENIQIGACGYGWSEISSNGNFTGGGGGYGYRLSTGDGSSKQGCVLIVYFPQYENELWIRYYWRYPPGFAWESPGGREPDECQWDKYLYLRGTHLAVIGEEFQRVNLARPDGGREYGITNRGFRWRNGGNTGDGQFHKMEVYVKNNTAGVANGIVRCWIDDVLVLESTTVDWKDSSGNPSPGWDKVFIPSNKGLVKNGGRAFIDYDDLKISSIAGDRNPPSPPGGLTIKE